MKAQPRFAALYEGFYDAVHKYCLRRTSYEEVDDVVAQVFLTAWRKVDQAPLGDEAVYWLYRIAYLTIRNQWRAKSRRKDLKTKLAGIGVGEHPKSPEDYLVHDEESRMALEAASRLRSTDREVLMLSEWEQLSIAEMATVLDLSPNAVRQRLYRARKNLTTQFNRIASDPNVTPAAQEGGAQ